MSDINLIFINPEEGKIFCGWLNEIFTYDIPEEKSYYPTGYPNIEDLMTGQSTNEVEKSELKKKRGRKPQTKEISKKSLRQRENDDNIRRKIKCHFHNFIINYFNYLIKKNKKGNLRFKKIKYSYALNDSIKFNQDLLQKKISEFFKLDISIKYKNYQKNENELVYEKLIKRFDNEILKLFDLTYIQFYQQYYLNESFNLNNSKINNFYDLYKKEQIKESNENKYSDLLKLIAEQRFINYYFPNKIFKTEKKLNNESKNELQLNSSLTDENQSHLLDLKKLETISQKSYEDEENDSHILFFKEEENDCEFLFD